MTNREWLNSISNEEFTDFCRCDHEAWDAHCDKDMEFEEHGGITCRVTIANDSFRPTKEDCKNCFMKWLDEEHINFK